MPAEHWYNEIDEGAARWLEELIAEDLIPRGVVDRRSIKDVRADDLRRFTSCHFFAGIGIWPAALRRGGWPDGRPVWTGSCPCQPFSPAGKGLGFDDPRHLWPDWFRLIAECRPDAIFGEQSAAAGLWLDLVRADLEGLGAAFGSPDLPAAGFAQGAHIRQRLYWMADFDNAERWADVAARHFGDWPQAGRIEGYGEPRAGGAAGGLGHSECIGARRNTRTGPGPQNWSGMRPGCHDVGSSGSADGMGDGAGEGWIEESLPWGASARRLSVRPAASGSLRGVDWLICTDQRIRPVEAGTFPLAASDPTRVGLLRGYGNALDFETAANFVGAYLEAEMLS